MAIKDTILIDQQIGIFDSISLIWISNKFSTCMSFALPIEFNLNNNMC
jgi:hypothetical protein